MLNLKNASLAVAAALALGWASTPALAARIDCGTICIETMRDVVGGRTMDLGTMLARRGADDAAGGDRGGRGRGRGRDDGAGHASRSSDLIPQQTVASWNYQQKQKGGGGGSGGGSRGGSSSSGS